ncbi:NAD(P)/FAD-dependent oxidoreductase [Sphingosinicella microcystinivorans]|uniref:D-arginine dehydrogenase n=1 Tax=Sphingosinicella microcystinivorans TaxID=335406 RepID=A0AAD1D5I7_SPHMI|nr:FAD-binding oxidoreductase [Sphingosinicella microcystinivorans]RKS91054.1 D-arginine dehydrogenase [Sphingosinicella microcystinivorans]BBE33975.1 FAD-dependent catabolic D-arginine dehydrogenase DauA [Sphingosinicella microcystinivorans]
MKYDAIVIGGGFAGTSAAYFLSQAANVMLIEGETSLGTQSSGRSAEQFTVGIAADTMRGLGAASRSFFDNPPDGFCEGPLLSPRGCLTVGSMEQKGRLDALVERLVSVKAEAQILSGSEALGMFPSLLPAGVECGVYEPGAADIDSNKLLQGYVRGARLHGATIESGQPAISIRKTAKGWEVTTPSGCHEAAVLVNAAGAWVDEVAAMAGIEPVGIMPMRRTAFTFAAPTGVRVDDWPHIFKVGRQWYLKPEAGRFMGSLAEEVLTPPGDVYPDDIDVAQAIENIQADTDLEVGRPLSTWAGLRNFVRDRNPLCGVRASDPSFVWVAAQGGCGVLTSPALGAAAAAAALGQPLPEIVSAFGITSADLSPDRLSLNH